jgi:hypothetical protein
MLLGVMPMSLTDPTVITISAVPISLPRISVGDDKSEYQSGDGLTKLTVSHLYQQGRGDRTRRMARIDVRKIAADWAKPAENVEVSMACYVVFDLPLAGYSPTEAKAAWDGFNTALQASSGAMITKILGGES